MDDYKNEMVVLAKEEKALKTSYRKQLKGLTNVSGLFRYLNETCSWRPIGFVDIELTKEERSGYPGVQCARIKYNKDTRLYIRTTLDEYVRHIDHYYVWQTTGYLEDDYSGFLLIPLNIGQYFKVEYSC
jgi:hypothetical protein